MKQKKVTVINFLDIARHSKNYSAAFDKLKKYMSNFDVDCYLQNNIKSIGQAFSK
jgi:hypothetical protein